MSEADSCGKRRDERRAHQESYGLLCGVHRCRRGVDVVDADEPSALRHTKSEGADFRDSSFEGIDGPDAAVNLTISQIFRQDFVAPIRLGCGEKSHAKTSS